MSFFAKCLSIFFTSLLCKNSHLIIDFLMILSCKRVAVFQFNIVVLCHLAFNISCWSPLCKFTPVACVITQAVFANLRQTISELWCLSGGKREDYQHCYVLYCVLKLCTVVSTLRWAILTVLWIGFCHTRPISLCVDLFVFICVYFVFLFHTA